MMWCERAARGAVVGGLSLLAVLCLVPADMEAGSCGSPDLYDSPSIIAGSLDIIGAVDGVGASAGFSYITGLRYDSTTGDIIVLDQSGVRRATTGGVVTTWRSGSVPGYSNFSVDAQGNLWVQTNGTTLEKTTPAGVSSTLAMSQSVNPSTIAVAPNGDIYIAYYAGRPAGCSTPSAPDCGGLVRVDASTGQVTPLFENNTMSVPTDMAFDDSAALYIADPNYQRIHRFDLGSGTDSIFVSSTTVFGVAVDDAGDVYAGGRRYNATGAVVGQGFSGHSYGVTVDPDQNVYVPIGVYNNGWRFAVQRYDDACDACPDADGDGICGDVDTCPGGDDNVDTDGDGVADFCDACPNDPANDADGDGFCADVDTCPGADDNLNADGDALPDACDVCPNDAANDADGDGVCADVDTCPLVANDNQADQDGDNVGDACDPDIDGDGDLNDADNCPFDANADQADTDGDGAGDACDDDADGDGVIDADDACLPSPIGEAVNADGCAISELCPCAHPHGQYRWKNHGAYVSCVAHAANDFMAAGLITGEEHGAIVSAAGWSSCGHKN